MLQSNIENVTYCVVMLFTGDSEEEAGLVIDDEMEVSQPNQLSDNNEYVYTAILYIHMLYMIS